MSHLFRLLLFYLLSSFIGATPTPSTQNACKDIEAAAPGRVAYPTGLTQTAYDTENKDYWNVGLSELKPTCILLPTDAQMVSKAIQVLNKYQAVKFAVKSGGHSPDVGHASVQDGVLIALKFLNGTTLDESKKVAYVKPGGHWSDVIAPLDKQGYTVVGGRLGIVGVGGYLAQGGLSFLSAQYGMACDNVIGWELVTANGSIVNVTPKSHPELAVALRGSGNQFGIVTKFTMNAHPIGKVWGGYRIYTSSYRDQVLRGFHEFVGNPNPDPKAAIIVNTNGAAFGTTVYMVFFFYDGPKPPPGAFGSLMGIKSTLDLCTTRTYTELLNFNARGVDLLGSRASFRSITLPYMSDNPNWYGEIESSFTNISASYMKNHYTSVATVAFQAFPGIIGKQTESRGGNAMGLTANDKNRFILEINYLWRDGKEDATIHGMARQLTDVLDKKLAEIKANSKMSSQVETYLPFFMNDAAVDQDVTASYKNVAKFKALQQQMDPNGLWKRAGGFKYD